MEEISGQEKVSTPLLSEEEVWNAKMKELKDFIDLNTSKLQEFLGLEKSYNFKVDLLDKISSDLGMTREELKLGYASVHPLCRSGVSFKTRPVFDTEDGYIVKTILDSFAKKIAECSQD